MNIHHYKAPQIYINNVCDFFCLDFLKEPLDRYMKKLSKVRILRTEKREGLIRCRLMGYKVARAPVLVFLDSHIECFPGTEKFHSKQKKLPQNPPHHHHHHNHQQQKKKVRKANRERGNPLPPHGLLFPITARVILYAPSHRQDCIYHGICYTSRGALAVTRNSSMSPPHEGSIRRPIAP